VAGRMTSAVKDTFVKCAASCATCQHRGTVDVWPYPDETQAETAERFTRLTRLRCLGDCTYVAKAQQERRQEP
jgi:hypothetical protein